MAIIEVHVTYKHLDEAKKVSQKILGDRLAACVNYMPITSYYWWEKKIKNSEEILAVYKTQSKHWRNIVSAVLEAHSYDVPCVTKHNITANSTYKKWVEEST